LWSAEESTKEEGEEEKWEEFHFFGEMKKFGFFLLFWFFGFLVFRGRKWDQNVSFSRQSEVNTRIKVKTRRKNQTVGDVSFFVSFFATIFGRRKEHFFSAQKSKKKKNTIWGQNVLMV
jgi:hypothetical protein